jgi:hypothetical protein
MPTSPAPAIHTTLATDQSSTIRWHNILIWGLEGRAWSDTEHPFDRLPARANGVVRDVVWNLSRNSAGLSVRFETDSPSIAARWILRADPGIKQHMPPVAVAGLDLYAQDPQGTWRWLSIGKPETIPTIETTLVEGLAPGKRAYTIYLPLFANVESLEIGVPADASFSGIPPRANRPIAFYGTSIVHGAAASRPGMTHSAILGRRLNYPVLNLGFSGNGQMEPEVGRFLAELDPLIYVIDCLPNMTAAMLEERAAPLIRTLRTAHPQISIVLVEDRTYAGSIFKPAQHERNATSRAAFRRIYENLLASGVSYLHYVGGDALLGDDDEATVDSSHPTDLGFMRQAAVLESVLRPLL